MSSSTSSMRSSVRSSARKSSLSNRTPLRDIKGVQEQVNNAVSSVMKVVEEMENPFQSKSKLARTPPAGKNNENSSKKKTPSKSSSKGKKRKSISASNTTPIKFVMEETSSAGEKHNTNDTKSPAIINSTPKRSNKKLKTERTPIMAEIVVVAKIATTEESKCEHMVVEETEVKSVNTSLSGISSITEITSVPAVQVEEEEGEKEGELFFTLPINDKAPRPVAEKHSDQLVGLSEEVKSLLPPVNTEAEKKVNDVVINNESNDKPAAGSVSGTVESISISLSSIEESSSKAVVNEVSVDSLDDKVIVVDESKACSSNFMLPVPVVPKRSTSSCSSVQKPAAAAIPTAASLDANVTASADSTGVSSVPSKSVIPALNPIITPKSAILIKRTHVTPVASTGAYISAEVKVPSVTVSPPQDLDVSEGCDISWKKDLPVPMGMSITASSFPSAPVFDEMVNLSISMVNNIDKQQQLTNGSGLQFQQESDSSSETIVIPPAAPAIASIAYSGELPQDAMSRYLLHPSEFKELLKAFRSPPKKGKNKRLSPAEKRAERSTQRNRRQSKDKKNINNSSRVSFPFTLESLDGLKVKSYDAASLHDQESSVKSSSQKCTLLTTAVTVIAAASAAIEVDANELDCPNPFAVKKTLVRTPIKPPTAAVSKKEEEEDKEKVDESAATVEPRTITAEFKQTTAAPEITVEEVVAEDKEEISSSVPEDDDIPIMEINIDSRLMSERQSIEPFGGGRGSRRSSIDDLRRESGQRRRLPRGSLRGPVDDNMIDEDETSLAPHSKKQQSSSTARASEVAFLKDEVLRLREELNLRQNEAKNERLVLIERLGQLESNLMRKQTEDIERARYAAEYRVLNAEIKDTEYLLRRLAREQEGIIQRQLKRSEIQRGIDREIESIASFGFVSESVETVSAPSSSTYRQDAEGVYDDFDNYHTDANDDFNFEVAGEGFVSSMMLNEEGTRYSLDIGGVSPVQNRASTMPSIEESQQLSGLEGLSKKRGRGAQTAKERMTFVPLGSKKEFIKEEFAHRPSSSSAFATVSASASASSSSRIPHEFDEDHHEDYVPQEETENIMVTDMRTNKQPVSRRTTKSSVPPQPRLVFVPLLKKPRKNKAKNNEVVIEKILNFDDDDFLPAFEETTEKTATTTTIVNEKVIHEDKEEEEAVDVPSLTKKSKKSTSKSTKTAKKSKSAASRKKNSRVKSSAAKKFLEEEEEEEEEEANELERTDNNDYTSADDSEAFAAFSAANLADVKKMKPRARQQEIDSLLQQLWDVATTSERAQWYASTSASSIGAPVEENIAQSPCTTVPTVAPIEEDVPSITAASNGNSKGKRKMDTAAANVKKNDKKEDFFPASPERANKKRRTARGKSTKKVEEEEEEEEKGQDEISRQLDEVPLPIAVVKRPANLVAALPTINQKEMSHEETKQKDVAVSSLSSAKSVTAKAKAKAKEEEVLAIAAPGFKSSAFMKLQQKENVAHIDSKEMGNKKGNKKIAAALNMGGEKENMELTEGALDIIAKRKTSNVDKLSLNSSVSSIASVLSQTSGHGNKTSTFVVPKLKKMKK